MTQTLSHKQVCWLFSRGGRTGADVVLADNGDLYVLMGDGRGGLMPVEVPSNAYITQDMYDHKRNPK